MMPFQGMRVVELGSGVALAYCGKLFADFGAEVVKAEPPGGDPLRSFPPLVETGSGNAQSAYFAWLNTNKRSITAEAGAPADAERLRNLIARADVLLDSRPPREVRASALRHSELRALNKRLVVTAICSFGETGPYADFVATESVCRALAGAIHGLGPVEGPPSIPIAGQSGIITGLAAFLPTAAGLYRRAGQSRGEGRGSRFSVSMHETLVHVMEMDVSTAISTGKARRRPGVNRAGRHYPSSIYRTRDGWIGISTVTPAQWRGFCAAAGRPDIGADPRYATSALRLQAEKELDEIFEPILAERSSAEWFEIGMRHRLALVQVPSMQELLQQEVHRNRGAFVPVRIGEASFEGPILPQRLGHAGPLRGGTAPLPGADDAAFPDPGSPPAPQPAQGGEAPLPLAGVRIVDLTMGWAGPAATRMLADLGAEVIKIESCSYFDWWRGADRSGSFLEQRLYEKNTNFNMMNRNKLAVTLDLTRSEGTKALKQLVATAHGVIENYSAAVMPKLGLSYEALCTVRPGLVMLSMPAFGSKNPWSGCRAYGGTLEQASGLPSVTGEPDGPPAMSSYAYGDPVGGFNAACSMMLALLQQQRTGEGRHVDMSQVEGMLPLAASKIVEQSATGSTAPRLGNRHPQHVPHGCFRCAGTDEWIVVAVTDAAAWRALCGVIGRADLAQDPALVTEAGRRIREAEIEAAVQSWTRTVPAHGAMGRLQEAGVPAGVALPAAGLLEDAHLRARGFWQVLDRPYVGPCIMPSAPFREGDSPYPARRPAPTLGQDNAEVFGRILRWDAAALEHMAALDVIGTAARAEARPAQLATAGAR